MVVCKFFLQGTCKFGTYCHYDHQLPSNYNYTNYNENNQKATSILRQANFSTVNTQPAKPPGTASIDTNTLVKSVVADMTGAEKGGQWLLSCYAPFKEKPAFPGFEDQSPEEIRFGFYEAQKNGTVEQYKQQLHALVQNNLMKVRALQNPSPEVVSILQNIYSTPALSSSGTYGQNTVSTSSSFGQQANNIFAQNQSPLGQGNDAFKTSIFGATPTNSSIFGASQPALPQTNNIFASIAPASTTSLNKSMFGGQLQQQPTNMFANSGQPVNASNIFTAHPSNSPQQSSNNVFAPASQNIFALPASTQPPIFPQQQHIFGAQNQLPQNVQQNIFASNVPQQQPNMFGALNSAPQQSAAPPSYSASIFGSNVNANPTVAFGSVAVPTVDESLYSKAEELSAEEKKWFETDTLDIFSIPDKPPTYDMCFKV